MTSKRRIRPSRAKSATEPVLSLDLDDLSAYSFPTSQDAYPASYSSDVASSTGFS
jgi:hypothetical protein